MNLSNSGAPANNVELNELLPAGMANYTWSAPDCTTDVAIITCSDISVGKDGQVTIPISGVPIPDTPPATCGTDRVSGYIVVDPPIEPEYVDGTIEIPCVPQYSWTKSAISETVNPGDTVGFVLYFENTGNTELDIELRDALPELPDALEWDVSVNTAIKAQLHCIGADGASFTTPSALACASLELRPGGYFEIAVTYMVPEDIGIESEFCGTVSNTATATSIAPFRQTLVGRALIADRVETNVDTNTAVYHVSCTGVSIQKSVSDTVVDVGGTVTYSIVVTNNGNSVVNDVVVEDDVSEASAVFSNWRVESAQSDDCAVADVIRCEFDQIDPSNSVTITITADAPAIPTLEQCEPVSNVASFSYQSANAPELLTTQSAQTPPQTRIESNAVVTMLDCQPGLGIAKVGEPNPGADGYMDVGDTISYTITVENTGNMTVYAIDVTDELIDAGSWGSSGTSVDELQPGEVVEFSAEYAVTAEDIEAGQVTNTASVQGVLAPEEDEPSFTSTFTIHAFGMAMMQISNDLAVSAEITIVTQLEVAPEEEPIPVETATPPATPEPTIPPATPEPTTPPATPTPTAPPDPVATPDATPAPEKTPDSVTGLPSTGSGSASVVLPVIWAAAAMGALTLGIMLDTGKRREM